MADQPHEGGDGREHDLRVAAEAREAALRQQLEGLQVLVEELLERVKQSGDHTAWFPAMAALLAASDLRKAEGGSCG